MEKKFREKDSTTKYTKKVPRGDKSEICKACLNRLRNIFLNIYDARNQKAYMHSGLVKPWNMSVHSMSSGLKILKIS